MQHDRFTVQKLRDTINGPEHFIIRLLRGRRHRYIDSIVHIYIYGRRQHRNAGLIAQIC